MIHLASTWTPGTAIRQSRQPISDHIRDNEIKDVVFITGDTHTSWAFEATNTPFEGYIQETGEGAFAVEFGTTSINSANSNERFPTEEVLLHEDKIVNSPINPHLKYTNMRDHGYMILKVMPEQTMAVWKYVETLKEPDHSIKATKAYSVRTGEVKLNAVMD